MSYPVVTWSLSTSNCVVSYYFYLTVDDFSRRGQDSWPGRGKKPSGSTPFCSPIFFLAILIGALEALCRPIRYLPFLFSATFLVFCRLPRPRYCSLHALLPYPLYFCFCTSLPSTPALDRADRLPSQTQLNKKAASRPTHVGSTHAKPFFYQDFFLQKVPKSWHWSGPPWLER